MGEYEIKILTFYWIQDFIFKYSISIVEDNGEIQGERSETRSKTHILCTNGRV